MIPTKLGLKFGALSDPISTQLRQQGFKFNVKEIMHLQEDLQAIQRLRIKGYVGDALSGKLYDKLFKKISKHLGDFGERTEEKLPRAKASKKKV